ARQEIEERLLALGRIGLDSVLQAPALLRIAVLGGGGQQLGDRSVISLRCAANRLRLRNVVAAHVVAEQVQANLDRFGRSEVFEEGRHRARLRRGVDQPEQERRRFFGQELCGLAQQVLRCSGLQLIDAIGPELVRIAFRADEQRWDAEHQLGRLRRVDLDREGLARARDVYDARRDRKSTRLNSSHRTISYAVFCLKKKKNIKT